MRRDEVNNRYFKWLCQIIDVGGHVSYQKLLMYLHRMPFVHEYKDSSRASDGENLRRRFYDEALGVTRSDLLYLNEPCSVLEMMVALAVRCEESIMDDPRYGNRTKQWFWQMVRNLGLNWMSDEHFDRDECRTTIDKFLNHEYSPDGTGGLFTIRGCNKDLRKYDIWTQLCWYLDSIS